MQWNGFWWNDYTDCFNRNNPKNPNEAILVYGDVSGQVNALLFSAATIALFDRPSQHTTSDKQGKQLFLEHMIIENNKISYLKHEIWNVANFIVTISNVLCLSFAVKQNVVSFPFLNLYFLESGQVTFFCS